MIGDEWADQIMALAKQKKAKMGTSRLCETEVELLRLHFVRGRIKKKLHEGGRREQRRMRHRKREMRVRERVRGNIGNNAFTAVEIKFSIPAHTDTHPHTHTHTYTHTHTHLQLSPSGWHCVIWHIHFLGWVCLQCCRGSHKPPLGYSSQYLNDVTFETHSLNCKQISTVEKCLARNCPIFLLLVILAIEGLD